MNCPKCKQVSLIDSTLAETLAVKSCPECEGNWLPGDNYKAWIADRSEEPEELELFSKLSATEFVLPITDAKAGFCPECNRYMSRTKVNIKTPFYLERCFSCGGFWCDQGEWNVLEKLGLHTSMENLFSTGWQGRAREYQQGQQERQAVVDKIGQELAAELFKLASVLEKHPNGDFAAAYLMRRFDSNKDNGSNQSDRDKNKESL